MKSQKGKTKSSSSNVKNVWRPVPVDIDVLQDEFMSGFAGLEEITDYSTLQVHRKGKVTSKTFITKFQATGEEWSNSSSSTKDTPVVKRAKKPKKDEREAQVEKSDDLRKKKKWKKKRGKVMKKITTTTASENQEEHQSDEQVSAKMKTWEGLFVPPPVLRALSDLGFDSPTPIQAIALPSAIRDRMDILGAAQTGSGKTLAFGVPLLHFILEAMSKESYKEKKLHALVLAPTRELAIQVKNHLEAAAKYTAIKVAVVVGGMAPEKQKRILQRKPEIVVATPGRLWELYEEGEEHLQEIPFISHLVIDEADRMAEKGHFQELQNVVELLKREGDNKCQVFVFSATLTLTHDIPKRLRLKKRKFQVDKSRKLETIMSLLGIKRKPKIIDLSSQVITAESLMETRIFCDLDQKDIYLYYFWLNHPGRTLVFCNSIDCVRRLQSLFELLNCHPLSLHANMQQRQRLKNLDRFKTKEHCLLLASDVAARGLDICNVQHVVHYQVPRTAEIYVHRSGRTARAQNEGLSVMLVSPEEVHLYRKMSRTLNREGDLPEFPVDPSLYSCLQERVACARELDKLLHTQSRAQAQNRWIQQAAEAFEVDIDEDYELSKVVENSAKSGVDKRQIQALKRKLQTLLKNLSPPGYYSRYPTQTGTLVLSKVKRKGSAMEYFKSKKTKTN